MSPSHRLLATLIPPLAALLLTGCETRLTWEEAKIAAEESALSSQAENLTAVSVELATDFTIGGAVEAAAEEIRTFVASQLPCAEVTVALGRVDVEYGAKPGSCTYRGHTFEGRHSITVARNHAGEVVVDHEWDDFTNGFLTVSGTATVTWSFDDPSRHVVHELTWTRLSDGRTGKGSGDRIQRPLDGDILQGIVVDGSRRWVGKSGTWDLSINQVEMRWIDPVPQSGSYSLDTPFDQAVSLSFRRVDEATIEVTVSGGRKDYEFRVSRLGAVK